MLRIYYRLNQSPFDDIHDRCMFVNNCCMFVNNHRATDVRARAWAHVFIIEKITLIYILLNYTYKK